MNTKWIEKFETLAELEAYVSTAEPGYYMLQDMSDTGLTSVHIVKVGATPPVPPPPTEDYFRIVANELSTVQFSNTGRNLKYSLDGVTFSDYTGQRFTLSAGDKLYWKRATNSVISGGKIGYFTLIGNVDIEGDITTLLTSDSRLSDLNLWTHCCEGLFDQQVSIRNASGLTLPATALGESCYMCMFQACNGLTTAPALPATTLDINCYAYMFNGCRNLTAAPALPATTVRKNCYRSMFQGCTSLTTAPALPATILDEDCYVYMFHDCSGLTTAPALPATTLQNSCYYGMFQDCENLVQAPYLPATQVVKLCYARMFYGCNNLNEIRINVSKASSLDATQDWVAYVAPAGDFYNSGTVSFSYGDSGVPTGWRIHSGN